MSVNINDLCYNDFPKICRTCLSNKNLQPLYTNKNLVDIFVWLKCGSKNEFEIEGFLPNQICSSCIEELIHCYSFLTKCKIVNVALKKCLGLQDNDVKKDANLLVQNVNYNTSSALIIERTVKKENIQIKNSPAIEVIIKTPNSSYNSHKNINIENASNSNCIENKFFNSSSHSIVANIIPPRIATDIKIENTQEELESELLVESSHKRKKNKSESDEDYQVNSDDETSDSEFEDRNLSNIFANKNKVVPVKVLKGEELEENKGTIIQAVASASKKCPICSKHYVSTNGMKLHMERHGITKDFIDSIKPLIIKKVKNAVKCHICHKMIGSTYYLKKHMRIHERQKIYELPQIFHKKSVKKYVKPRINYDIKKELVIRDNHTKYYECQICKERFGTVANLSQHEQLHIKEHVQTGHICDICNKQFLTERYLRNHKDGHKFRMRFECEFCHLCYKKSSRLHRHVLIHTDVKSYMCELCNKSFKYKHSLVKHRLDHFGVRPYKCGVCKKSFRDSSNYSRHLLIHDKKRIYA